MYRPKATHSSLTRDLQLLPCTEERTLDCKVLWDENHQGTKLLAPAIHPCEWLQYLAKPSAALSGLWLCECFSGTAAQPCPRPCKSSRRLWATPRPPEPSPLRPLSSLGPTLCLLQLRQRRALLKRMSRTTDKRNSSSSSTAGKHAKE